MPGLLKRESKHLEPVDLFSEIRIPVPGAPPTATATKIPVTKS